MFTSIRRWCELAQRCSVFAGEGELSCCTMDAAFRSARRITPTSLSSDNSTLLCFQHQRGYILKIRRLIKSGDKTSKALKRTKYGHEARYTIYTHVKKRTDASPFRIEKPQIVRLFTKQVSNFSVVYLWTAMTGSPPSTRNSTDGTISNKLSGFVNWGTKMW